MLAFASGPFSRKAKSFVVFPGFFASGVTSCPLLVCSIETVEDMIKMGVYVNDLNLHDSSRELILAGTQQSAELQLALDQVSHRRRDGPHQRQQARGSEDPSESRAQPGDAED